MLNLKRGSSNALDTKTAVNTVVSSIKQDEIKLVLFFASPKYDFALASKMMKDSFQTAEVIGCTTAGELGPNGMTCGAFDNGMSGHLVAMSVAADDFTPATAVMKDIRQRALLSKNAVLNAFSKTGMDINDPNVHNKGFGILLIDGLQGAEEKVMSVFSSIFNDFPIVGGSAGDDAKYVETFVSANGEIYSNAAIVTFVKTSKKFMTYKENIYVATEKELKVTKVDLDSRIVYEFNNKPAVKEYARVLGVAEENITNDFLLTHPVGRQFADSIWITSPRMVVGEGISFGAQIMENAVVKILKAVDPIAEAKTTVNNIKESLPTVKGVIAFNCGSRYGQFVTDNICKPVFDELAKLGEVIGFTTYGEQYMKYHVNQTLTLIAIGE